MSIDLATTDRQYLRLDEVCQVFGFSRTTIYNWIHEGKLATILVGSRRRVSIHEVRRLAAGQKNDPLSPAVEEKPSNPVNPRHQRL